MTDTLVLTNARIRTIDPAQPLAEAIAIQGERIVAVGKANEMPDGRTLDLGGRLVLPGFIDSHLHIMSWALAQQAVPLDDAPSLDVALARVAERVQATPPGQWVTGWGWNHNEWPSGFPNRYDLDRVAPNHPVLLTRKDGHMTWGNSLALQLAGVTRDTPDPFGGAIRRDEQGEPNGLFAENANGLVRAVIPEPDAQQRRAALAAAWPLFHRLGLVGGHEMGFSDPLGLWDDFASLEAEGKLPWRITHYIHKHQLDQMIERGMRSWDGDATLRVGGLKIFMDGSLGSQTADMIDDFEGQPGNRGIITTEVEELHDLVMRGAAAGISMCIHAIGDAANRKCLDAFQAWRATSGQGSRLRQRIEHVQVLHPDDLGRLADLGIIASVQPIHCTSDMFISDKYWGKRARYAYAFCTLLQRGTRLAFGSDAPVETPDVMVGIHAAVTRQRANGQPEGGWYPEERLGVYEAVHAYTQGAAYATGEEAIKGSLTPGKLADLVVLDQDIFTIPAAEILNTQIDATMLGGAWVYKGRL